MTAQTAKQLEKQLLALGIPDWATARYLMSEAAAMLRSQAAEIERLTLDAERYRWLFGARTEAECHAEKAGETVLPQDVVLGELSSWYYPKEAADKAIDAARAALEAK